MKKTANRTEAGQESSVPLGGLEVGSMVSNGQKKAFTREREGRKRERLLMTIAIIGSHDP